MTTERGAGRTTRQMAAAPRGAFYIWANGGLHYADRLAHRIGRSDLKVRCPSFITAELYRNVSAPRFVFDHALTERVRGASDGDFDVGIVSRAIEKAEAYERASLVQQEKTVNRKTATQLVDLYNEHERVKALRDRVRKGSVNVSIKITSIDIGQDGGRTIYGFTEKAIEGGETANIANTVRRSIVENMADQLNALKDRIAALGGEAP